MKKYISVSIILALILTCFTVPTFAANSVTEKPDVKIVINGQLGTYKDTPINLNNRTLLPLREILVNLGVNDDNEHIAWNGKEKSVTVSKDSTKIYLKIGSNKATVNGKEIVLDTSPVVYKDRTYIPVNFVAQSLGKKVVWDGSSKSVLVRDEEGFNQIKSILNKTNTAMDSIENCKGKVNASVTTDIDESKIDMDINMDMLVDMLKKELSINMNMDLSIIKMNMDFYFADNTMYMKNPLSDQWEKCSMSESEYQNLFDNKSNVDILDESDALCAGLKEVNSSNANEILLKGDTFLGDLMNLASSSQGTDLSNVIFDKFNVEISIDKTTNRLNSIIMSTKYYMDNNKSQSADMTVKCIYSDYNSNINVVIPEDAIKNAVENPDLKDSF